MTNPLLVCRSLEGTYVVRRHSSPPEEWSVERLRDFLVANGYTAHDAHACINEANVAHEIRIGLPD